MDTWVKVTDDPALDALLRERVETMSSRALAEYAHSLGLYPPGYGDQMDPPIAVTWPPGTPFEADGVLVWDIGDDNEDELHDGDQ